MKHHEVTQGSPEWYDLRRGIPTASCFGRICTASQGQYATGATTYMAELIARACGAFVPGDDFQGSPDTERGNYLERDARRWLRFQTGEDIRKCGFFTDDEGRYGGSPDGIRADGSPVEIKAPALHTFIRWRMAGDLPAQHKVQCHGEMLVTGADRCTFLAYADSAYVDNWVIEVRRDAFTQTLSDHLVRFCDELQAWKDKLIQE